MKEEYTLIPEYQNQKCKDNHNYKILHETMLDKKDWRAKEQEQTQNL